MGADPIGQRLAEAGLGEGVVRCPQDRDEYLRSTHLSGEPVEHRHGIAGEVHVLLNQAPGCEAVISGSASPAVGRKRSQAGGWAG
jgi:hypothetical protein